LNIRVSGNRYIEAARFQAGLGYDATQLGFPASLVSQLPTKMFPRFEISDYIQLGRGSLRNEPTNVLSIQPNLSLIRGAHTMRFGLDWRYTQYARQTSGNAGMRLTFDRTFTQKDFNRSDPLNGSGLAGLLLGIPSSGNGIPSGGNIDNNVYPIYLFKYYALWFQADWKFTRKLTLTFGLRYDLDLP